MRAYEGFETLHTLMFFEKRSFFYIKKKKREERTQPSHRLLK
jgi:hypothetical protein